jgi:hypothetical protein
MKEFVVGVGTEDGVGWAWWKVKADSFAVTTRSTEGILTYFAELYVNDEAAESGTAIQQRRVAVFSGHFVSVIDNGHLVPGVSANETRKDRH